MCLAVPAKIIEQNGADGWVELGDTRVRVNLVMTPEAQLGDFVLIHAGFAIQTVDEEEAQKTWDILDELQAAEAEAEEDAS